VANDRLRQNPAALEELVKQLGQPPAGPPAGTAAA